MDECMSNPCENDGSCLNKEAMFECVCHQGFTGVVSLYQEKHSDSGLLDQRFIRSAVYWWYFHWLSMVRTGSNKHSVRTMKSEPVRTGSRLLKQSFGCGGKNLCCTLSVYYIAAEFCYKYGT